MIPQILLDSLDTFSDYEIIIICETLNTLYGTGTKYPFTGQKTVKGEWHKSDLLHYFNTIDFNTEPVQYMVIMGIFSTIFTQKRILNSINKTK